jgi:hypothetical protein
LSKLRQNFLLGTVPMLRITANLKFLSLSILRTTHEPAEQSRIGHKLVICKN